MTSKGGRATCRPYTEQDLLFEYNGKGERVSKGWVGGKFTATRYLYNESGAVAVFEDSNPAQETATSKAIIYIDQLPVGIMDNKSLFPIETDHLGTPRVVSDGNQAIWRWELVSGNTVNGGSNAFGDRPANEDPDGDGKTYRFDLRFPGQIHDPETGLHYNYFRDYEPGTGRYVESDPIGLWSGPSTYGYTWASPLRWFDPFGLAVEMCCRPADLPYPLSETDHCWLRTSSIEAGMGPMDGSVPAQNSNYDLPGDPTQTTNHGGEGNKPGSTCNVVPSQDEVCVDRMIQPGQPTGPFWPNNNCQTFAASVLNACRVADPNNPNTQPDIPKCRACISTFGGDSGLCQIACRVP
jgi:RHS repeat-associated protein